MARNRQRLGTDKRNTCLHFKREYPSKLGLGIRGDSVDGKVNYCRANRLVLTSYVTCLYCTLITNKLTGAQG